MYIYTLVHAYTRIRIYVRINFLKWFWILLTEEVESRIAKGNNLDRNSWEEIYVLRILKQLQGLLLDK